MVDRRYKEGGVRRKGMLKEEITYLVSVKEKQ
jgi:hypothetical protein